MNYSIHALRHARFIIGQSIRNLRTQHKMPLHKLSSLSRIPENRLDEYELGQNAISFDELFKIACVFGADVRELV